MVGVGVVVVVGVDLVAITGGVGIGLGWKTGRSVAIGLATGVVGCVGTNEGAVVNGEAVGVVDAVAIVLAFTIMATIFPGMVKVCPLTTSFTSASESPSGKEVCLINFTRRSGCPDVRIINTGLSSAVPAASAAGDADDACEAALVGGACANAAGTIS